MSSKKITEKTKKTASIPCSDELGIVYAAPPREF
jgi:hypothetical protein